MTLVADQTLALKRASSTMAYVCARLVFAIPHQVVDPDKLMRYNLLGTNAAAQQPFRQMAITQGRGAQYF